MATPFTHTSVSGGLARPASPRQVWLAFGGAAVRNVPDSVLNGREAQLSASLARALVPQLLFGSRLLAEFFAFRKKLERPLRHALQPLKPRCGLQVYVRTHIFEDRIGPSCD